MVLISFAEKEEIMLQAIYQDFKNEIAVLRLRMIQLRALIQLLISMKLADHKRRKLLRIEVKKYGEKAYDMNQNVMLMAVYDKNLKSYKEKLVIADNNEVIILARKLRWLPKRMTAPIMQSRNSVFYTTNPKMSKWKAVCAYMLYIEARERQIAFISEEELKQGTMGTLETV